MKQNQSQQRLLKLEAELQALQGRMAKTLKKSNDLFSFGGDGWHDNPAYELMNADVDIPLLVDFPDF